MHLVPEERFVISSKHVIAVVGATGAVGREALAILESRQFPASRLRVTASERSVGKTIEYAGQNIAILPSTSDSVRGCDAALFCASSDVARRFAPECVKVGCTVVDNSSAFRSDPGVPLVVPEVNGRELASHAGPCLVANPNCSTILLVVALNPIRRRFGIRRIVVSTYQAVSGAGAAAMEELRQQAADVLAGKPAQPKVFAEPCAFNIFSHNSKVDLDSGLNGEEAKIIAESRRIWADTSIEISPTCVRVPVLRAHAEAATITLEKPASEAEVRDAFADAPGVRLVDDRANNAFPTSLKASGGDDILVGRLRIDPSAPREPDGRSRHHCLLLSGDQLRKGAALNAIQIADALLR
jgi:aspartate-semialdehyde dehydrogenase